MMEQQNVLFYFATICDEVADLSTGIFLFERDKSVILRYCI